VESGRQRYRFSLQLLFSTSPAIVQYRQQAFVFVPSEGVVKLVSTNATAWETKASPSVRKPCVSFTSCTIQWRIEFHGESQ
jgi:hypothetical protein